MHENSFIYILTNTNNSVIYIGVTSNLPKRIWQHKNKVVEGFSKKYNLTKLVYFETFSSIDSAIVREKQLKRWHREWKFNLIKEMNPTLKDLYPDIVS